ncbi:MAG: hypothetical protein ABR927_10265 [Bacteroidales bacterium]|jgi:hypothetical protein
MAAPVATVELFTRLENEWNNAYRRSISKDSAKHGSKIPGRA